MKSFTKKTVGTLTLGEKLRKLRSERRMSLHEASHSTRIQVKYLEYLEDNAYEKLPANVYVRGFLKSYADFLGVDEKILLRLYDKESEIRKNLEKTKTKYAGSTRLGRIFNHGEAGRRKEKKQGVDISSFVFTPKIMVLSFAALLMLGGVFYLYKEIGSFASNPRLVILSPENNYTTDGNSVTVEGVTDRDALLFLNGQPILVNDDGKFRETVTVQVGVNVINIKAVNKFDKEASESLTVQSNYQENGEDANGAPDNNEASSQAEGQNQADIAATKVLETEVRVNPGPVWVSVEVDGNLVFNGTMLTGATQSFRAESKIVINSGRANATFVKFNGKDIGALGDSADAVRAVTFTPDTKL